MYVEKPENNREIINETHEYRDISDSSSWLGFLLRVIVVILLVYALLWFFPLTTVDTSKVEKRLDGVEDKVTVITDRIFAENIMTFKQAGKDYFSLSNMPKNTNEKVKITLDEMLDKKLLLNLTDSKGKSCDGTASYIEVTKLDDEYLMRINLKCGDYEDYIYTHLGCYNYCQGAGSICERESSTNNNNPSNNNGGSTEKMYKCTKLGTGYYGDWGSWSEWTTKVIVGNSYTEVQTKTVKETYQEPVTVDTEVAKVKYCPIGYAENATKTKCVKDGGTSIQYTDVTPECSKGKYSNNFECKYTETVKNGTHQEKKVTKKTNQECASKTGWKEVGRYKVQVCTNCKEQYVYRCDYEVTTYITIQDYKDVPRTISAKCPNGSEEYTNTSGKKACRVFKTVVNPLIETDYQYKCPVISGVNVIELNNKCYKREQKYITKTKDIIYYSSRTKKWITITTEDIKWTKTSCDSYYISQGYNCECDNSKGNTNQGK